MDRPRPLSETHPHLKDFTAFLDEFNKESDRGVALITVAMLDDLLEKIILAFLIETAESPRLVTGFNAPLGTFSARSIACYSLGLISEPEYRECDNLRKIRNEFAHNVHQSFEDQKVKDICRNLTYAVQGTPESPIPAKGQFTMAAVALILTLTNRLHYVGLKRVKYGNWAI